MIDGYNITSNFDSGNINIINKYIKNNKVFIELEIKKDPYQSHVKNKYKYWFYFKISDLDENKICKITIKNINNIDNDWLGFTVPYSYDNISWYRIKNTIVDLKTNTISWEIKPQRNHIWFSYYPPYPFKKSVEIAKKYNGIILGKVNNKPIYYIKKGTGDKHVWILARQHPGETIGSWMLEGFLLQLHKKKYNNILKHYTFHIIVNANPMGTIMGHWYTTEDGINMNRDWLNKKSKNVQIISKEILKTECYLCIDLHGEEGSKKHFIAYCYEKKNKLYNKINDILVNLNSNFRTTNYYTKEHTPLVNETYDCYYTGLTIEGAMKHNNEGKKSLQYTPIKIGKSIVKMFKKLLKSTSKNKTLKSKKYKNKTLKIQH